MAAGLIVFAAILCRSGPTCPTGARRPPRAVRSHPGPPHPRRQRALTRRQRALICRYALLPPSLPISYPAWSITGANAGLLRPENGGDSMRRASYANAFWRLIMTDQIARNEKQLGAILRRAYRQADLTQERLATRFTCATVSRLEAGEPAVQLRTLMAALSPP